LLPTLHFPVKRTRAPRMSPKRRKQADRGAGLAFGSYEFNAGRVKVPPRHLEWIPTLLFALHSAHSTLMPLKRLQKIIAAAGVASRRKAEELITSGHVQVNGTTITELGSKADAEIDHIRVNGKLLGGEQRHVYLLLNKPRGYVTTVNDPE